MKFTILKIKHTTVLFILIFIYILSATVKAEEIESKNLTEKEIKINNILKNAPAFSPTTFTINSKESKNEIGNVSYLQKEVTFPNGDVFNIFRFNFKDSLSNNFTTTIKLLGDQITIRYINPKTKEWVNTSNINNILPTTLFIDTDTHSYVVSIPGVYKNSFENSTLTEVPEKVISPKIEKQDGYFNLKIEFIQDKSLIGEIWTIKSEERLVDWSKKESFEDLLTHDLAIERRWSYDGYYFLTPYNYVPGGKNVFYKHPANYTGASWVKYGTSNLAKNLGYLMTEICMLNQNEKGYWETGPKSLWLEEDFKIGPGFYDTRFNSDFATSLLFAYQNYNNKKFLESALKYAEFFMEYIKENSYEVEGGGILVADYGYDKGKYEKTHVSLNHQLAEINFLYRLYIITNEKSYLDLADNMLLGIENTRNKWILEDGNLNYGLMYTKNTNKLVDYPYLTYNDLYETKSILKTYFNRSNDTIEFLLASKKQWMDKNNVKGYIGYKK